MSIEFACEQCGHRIAVDEHFEGKHGKCKHCGHPLTVPEHHDGHAPAKPHEPAADSPLRLRPGQDEEPPGLAAQLLAAQAPLHVRHAEADPRLKPNAVSSPDEPPPSPSKSRWYNFRKRTASGEYTVLDPYKATETHSSVGPPPFWVNVPTLVARFFAGRFRTLRDWLYLVSVASLVTILYAYIFGAKNLMHIAIIVCVASNISMLCVGAAYLLLLPFKDSLHVGLANLFPPFAVYYWIKHWHKMRRPVYKTLGSFVPIVLAVTAYVVYEDGPALEKKGAEAVSRIEKKFERLEDRLGLPASTPAGDSTKQETAEQSAP